MPLLRYVVVVLISCCADLTAHGQDDKSETETEAQAAKRFQAYARDTIGKYELKVRAAGDEGKKDARVAILVEKPILRWTNPLGGRRAHGEVFLWTDQGRPAAVVSLLEYTAPEGAVHEQHEFCSLVEAAIIGSGPGGRDWSPEVPGVVRAPLPGAPAPAASPRERLSQMRELGGRFSAKKITRAKETRTLRLLPQPVYRYEGKPSGETDGGLFAFVEATDPEAFLLLEVRSIDGKPQWHYAFARMTALYLSASLDDKQVWQVDQLLKLQRKDEAYTAFPVK
jgi:hypothetical protein